MVHLCHQVQSYHYFASDSSKFCNHNPLKGTAVSNAKGKCIFHYHLSPETFGYTLVYSMDTMFLFPIFYESDSKNVIHFLRPIIPNFIILHFMGLVLLPCQV